MSIFQIVLFNYVKQFLLFEYQNSKKRIDMSFKPTTFPVFN